MDYHILSQNIRRLRSAKRFSQKALAEASGLSLPSIKNLELGKAAPRMNTLLTIAGALDVRLQDLFYPVRELKNVRFRSNKRMQNRENILADMARWLDEFNYLEDILQEHIPFTLKDLRNEVSLNDIGGAADLTRKALNLDDIQPVHDLCGLLESSGIKIFPLSMISDGFFGLSVGDEDGGPAIAVNIWERISVERQIFSAAHELGHLILHMNAYDVSRTDENKDEERQADMFAGHFLMPDKGFKNEWNDAAGLSLVDRVFKIKRIFRVSYKTVLNRLLEYGKVDKDIWRKFNWAYYQQYKTKLTFSKEPNELTSEPFRMARFDFYADRLSRLTRKAVEEDKISLSKGAEILRISIDEMNDLLNSWEVVL